MSSFYLKTGDFLNNGKNFYTLFFFLVVFLCMVKLPSLLTTDIQPWDEGMYATRVLSISTNGDFWDQSSHSVGKFYSGSHPPLLIWIGYFVTSVFGMNSVALKLIPFSFSLLCALMIFLMGNKLFGQVTGFFAAVIFSGNIIFNIFSKRFQFDFPYTFFILAAFYFLFLYNSSLKYKYIFLCGISFGCCLMTKILVGFYIPIIIFSGYFFIKDKVNYNLKDILILTGVGVALAMPWHLYMLIKYGSEFTDYFFKFHVYERALNGVEMNEKNSGVFFYFNFLLSIIPISILMLFSFIKDFRNYKNTEWGKIFLWVWFITGLVIITLFRTKLEVYVILVLPPLCLLIPAFINSLDKENLPFKVIIIFFSLINIMWFVFKFLKIDIKTVVLLSENKLLLILNTLFVLTLLLILSRYLVNNIELKKTYYIFILVFFFTFNVYFAIRINEGETNFRISEIKELIKQSGKDKLIYIGSNYRFNPQFSFYFNGLDLNWENPSYKFEMLDTKNGTDKIIDKLNRLNPNDYFIIVERDKINRSDYPAVESFIPPNFRLITAQEGYELYGS